MARRARRPPPALIGEVLRRSPATSPFSICNSAKLHGATPGTARDVGAGGLDPEAASDLLRAAVWRGLVARSNEVLVFYFPCATCRVLSRVDAIHVWRLDEPFCSAACAGVAHASVSVDVAEAIDGSIALVHEVSRDVRATIPIALAAESRFRNAADLRSRIGPFRLEPVLGIVPAWLLMNAADASANEHVDLLHARLFALDRKLHLVARHTMRLEALGLSVALHLVPLAHDAGALGALTPSGVPDVLRRTEAHLRALAHELRRLAKVRAARRPDGLSHAPSVARSGRRAAMPAFLRDH